MQHIQFSPLIEAAALFEIRRSNDFVLIDASNSKDAKANYELQHLEGALFVDLNTQLADIQDDLSKGGRHPLPSIEAFSITLSQLGISKHSHVVLYDTFSASNAAARFWWMLKSIGHEKVQVINGGFQQASKIGFPIQTSISKPKKSEAYSIESWKLPTVNMEKVEEMAKNSNAIVCDVRDSNRYLGVYEPIDLVAGHIPGAINIPFSENLDSNGLFKKPDLLKQLYTDQFGEIQSKSIVIHCGSGVTACHTLLSMDYAGLEIPNIYVGSWSEWSRNKI